MEKYLIIFIIIIFIESIQNNLFCPKNSNPPRDIVLNSTFEINAIVSGKTYSTVIINDNAFFKESQNVSISANYYDYNYCPTNYIIPKKEDYESLISNLGNNSYTFLTDPKGFNMTENKYFLTKNKTSSGNYNFYCMYLEGNQVKIGDINIKTIPSTNLSINCKLIPPRSAKLVYSELGDIKYNSQPTIQLDNKYFNGYLWRISGNKYYKNSIIKPKFTQSGRQRIELWARLITGEIFYFCDYVYVKAKEVSSTQDFSNKKIKKIETKFKMIYTSQLHFENSNCPVSPRIDGGYYIAFTDILKYLHVLSYYNNDTLIKDFNTTQKGYIHDIAATNYGFSIYVRDALNTDHSYLSLYNKNFELINTVTIMNNNITNKGTDSDLSKQIIKYGPNGQPVFGMRFMYEPYNGKLIYSRGRIFLMFGHYNYFIDNGGHPGDTVTTFNDVLKDMDFGITWGASHSLIQSVTFDDLYFWTAALSDSYPEIINIEYISKNDFSTSYDPINQKYNTRVSVENEILAGYITSYHSKAVIKLGGIVYFEKLKLYVVVYTKTPTSESDGEENIIYATLWKFENKQYINKETKVIKNFGEDNNIIQLRIGKYGDNKLLIIYTSTKTKGSNLNVTVGEGTIPNLFVIELPSFKYLANDQQYDNLLMNTNEDLRTFDDGVIIWATANSSGNLVINKIGSPILDNSYDDVNYIITKNDLKEIENEYNEKDEGKYYDDEDNEDEEREHENEESKSLSGWAKFGISLGVISGVIIFAFSIFILYKYCKKKNSEREFNLNNLNNEMLLKN